MATKYSPRIVTDGLVLYLDAANPKSYVSGSSVWNDLTAYKNSGNSSSGNSLSTSKSVYFDKTYYYDCGNPESLKITGDEISLCAWINTTYTTGINDYLGILSKRYSYGAGNVSYALLLNNSIPNRLVFAQINNESNQVVSVYSNSHVNDGRYHYIIFVYNGIDARIYIDGNLDSTPVAFTGNIKDKEDSLLIGSLQLTGVSYLYRYGFSGSLAQVGIYNRALSPEEIKQNYNATRRRFNL